MIASNILGKVIEPALEQLEQYAVFSDARARWLLLAIAEQESSCLHRFQIGGGPGRGLWQFEQGAILGRRGLSSWGLLVHRKTAKIMPQLCADMYVNPDAYSIHQALAKNDVFAAACARLLLWTHPAPLPTDMWDAWRLYLEVWRPGKPREQHWPLAWAMAQQVERMSRNVRVVTAE